MAKRAKGNPASPPPPKPDMGAMTIERIPLSKINPAPYNPRKDLKPGDPAWEKLRESMGTFGYVEPLVWNKRSGNLVGGHQRFKVLRHCGAKEADVSVVDLTEAQEKALNVALNKVSGEWDQDALAKLMEDLEAASDEIDATLTGFGQAEIDELLAGLEGAGGEDDGEELEVETSVKKSERSGFNVHLNEELHELIQELVKALQAERPAGSREVSKHEAIRVAVMEAMERRERPSARKSENPSARTTGKSARGKGRSA